MLGISTGGMRAFALRGVPYVMALVLIATVGASCRGSKDTSRTSPGRTNPTDCDFESDGTLFDYVAGVCATPTAENFDKQYTYSHLYNLGTSQDVRGRFLIEFAEPLAATVFGRLLAIFSRSDRIVGISLVFPDAPRGPATVGTELDADPPHAVAKARATLVDKWTGLSRDWGDDWSATMVSHINASFDRETYRVANATVVTAADTARALLEEYDSRIKSLVPVDEKLMPVPPTAAQLEKIGSASSSDDQEAAK